MQARTFRFPGRTIAGAVAVAALGTAFGMFRMHNGGPTATIVAGCCYGLFLTALTLAGAGWTTRIDDRGITTRWLGISYQTFLWEEIADISSSWYGSRKSSRRYVVLLLVDHRSIRLPVPAPALGSGAGPRFDAEVAAIVEAWQAMGGPQHSAESTSPDFQDLVPVVPSAPPTALYRTAYVTRVGAAGTVHFIGRCIRGWFRSGITQWLLCVACLVGLVVSMHTVIARDQSVTRAYRAAAPCTSTQYLALADSTQLTSSTRWCILQNMAVTETVDGPSASDNVGVLVSPVLSSSGNAWQDLVNLSKTPSYDVFVYLVPGSALANELAPGDQMTVTATVQPLGAEYGGGTQDLAGSIEYHGVTTQTQNSPLVQQTSDLDSTFTFAGWALFFGLWGFKISRRRRGVTGWIVAVGATLGLAVGLTTITVQIEDNLNSASVLPALGVGALAGVVGGLVFLGLARLTALGRGRTRPRVTRVDSSRFPSS
jgi:hypothetical protein